uniref:ARAD1D04356p n=1 Tax=Blastobotrys adeninivorans TaxID=409370 RepID=A0A060TD46_BLAAD
MVRVSLFALGSLMALSAYADSSAQASGSGGSGGSGSAMPSGFVAVGTRSDRSAADISALLTQTDAFKSLSQAVASFNGAAYASSNLAAAEASASKQGALLGGSGAAASASSTEKYQSGQESMLKASGASSTGDKSGASGPAQFNPALAASMGVLLAIGATLV